MASKIKKGDEVIVLTGKDKGRRGVVLRVLPDLSKVLVEGINRVTKHVKPNPQKQQEGGLIEKEMPLHISNVALFNAATKKADRVGFREENGRKVRYFKATKENVDS